MKNNRHGCYEDYAREIDEEAERRAHEEDQCEGMPLCVYCLDEWEEQNREELDSHGYYDSKGRWTT